MPGPRPSEARAKLMSVPGVLPPHVPIHRLSDCLTDRLVVIGCLFRYREATYD